MGRGVILFCFLLFALGAGVHGFPMNDLISKLPGQPDVSFRQFAGYIDLDEKAGSSLFYYFVEAEQDPMTKPLTIWLTGGPGCSSVGDGFSSVGPFITTNNARGLQRNSFSWIKVSNLLFIDSPIGSGWSYSNTSSDYNNGDDSTTKNLMTFILKWFEKYPDFKSRDVYITGSSFAGHFVPNLANSLLDYNKQSNGLKINVKGLALGNPMLRKKLDFGSRSDFFFSQGMIGSELHQEIEKECTAIDENNFANTGTDWTAACKNLTDRAASDAFKTNDTAVVQSKLFDMLRAPCAASLEDLKSGKEVSTVSYDVDVCLPIRADFYFNIPEVQTAFHGNRTNLSYAWKGCFTRNFTYTETDTDRDMLPVLKNILQQSIPIMIFSGDQDAMIPTTGTRNHLNKLAEELNLKITKDEVWKHEDKDAGSKYLYGDLLSFWTVKGANHLVTFSRPSQALALITNFTTAGLH